MKKSCNIIELSLNSTMTVIVEFRESCSLTQCENTTLVPKWCTTIMSLSNTEVYVINDVLMNFVEEVKDRLHKY